MNARRDCSLFPALAEQLHRHVTRLPQLDGFIIDRLDWANGIDYGHDDGMTMIGKRPVENMAGPVAEGVAEVCRQAHAAGWRVYVNQFWRVEVLPRQRRLLPRERPRAGVALRLGVSAGIGVELPAAVPCRPLAVRGPIETPLAVCRLSADDRPQVSHLATGRQCQCGRPVGTVRAAVCHAGRQRAGLVAALRERVRSKRRESVRQSGGRLRRARNVAGAVSVAPCGGPWNRPWCGSASRTPPHWRGPIWSPPMGRRAGPRCGMLPALRKSRSIGTAPLRWLLWGVVCGRRYPFST